MGKMLAFERSSSPLEDVLQQRRRAPVIYLREEDAPPLLPAWMSRTLTALTWIAVGVGLALFLQLTGCASERKISTVPECKAACDRIGGVFKSFDCALVSPDAVDGCKCECSTT